MDERTRKWVFRILYAVGILGKVLSWLAFAFAALCIVNGNNWKMVFLFAISLFGLFISHGWLEAVDDLRERHGESIS